MAAFVKIVTWKWCRSGKDSLHWCMRTLNCWTEVLVLMLCEYSDVSMSYLLYKGQGCFPALYNFHYYILTIKITFFLLVVMVTKEIMQAYA